MLKLETNIIPIGVINGVNTIFTLPFVISSISNIIIDGVTLIGGYTFLNDKITLDVAPVTSITISYFKREERTITGNGLVTIGNLVEDIYEEIGRKKYSLLYPQTRLIKEINKTYGTLDDEMTENSRLQHYSFKGANGLIVDYQITNEITLTDSNNLDIEGIFLVGDGIYYNYYAFDGIKFSVYNGGLVENRDQLLVGHRIPYGVEKLSEVYINGVKLGYVPQGDFYINSYSTYTIIKDYQGNEYLMLPFSKEEYTCVVKFVPDRDILGEEEDIIDLPYKYTRAITYDIVYRILASREDERWQYYQVEASKEKKKYIGYKNKIIKKVRGKIGISSVYDNRSERVIEVLPNNIYDSYL